MIVPFEIAGATGGHKSAQFSSELTRNMIVVQSETNGRLACVDFPGLKLVSSGSGVDRGSHEMAGVRYLINGTSLIKDTSE